MTKRILMIGAETSLGQEFARLAVERHNVVYPIPLRHLHHSQGSGIANFLVHLGPVTFDWIVNCEGINRLDKIGETVLPVPSILEVNVLPLYWVLDCLVASTHPPARVLSVASQTYRIAQTNTALYCASKAALVQLSRTLARELAPQGWIINTLAPGKIVDTEMARLTDEQVLRLRGWAKEEADGYALRNVPMRRFTDRAEVCDAMFKILDLPPYINGACIDMTGGA